MRPQKSRQEWRDEFMELFKEARKRGDKRTRLELVNDWIKFRKEHNENA